MYHYLDKNFDIPNDGVISDIEELYEDRLDEQDDKFATQAAVLLLLTTVFKEV